MKKREESGGSWHSTIINLSPSHTRTQNVSNFSASRFADDFCLPLAVGIFPVPLKEKHMSVYGTVCVCVCVRVVGPTFVSIFTCTLVYLYQHLSLFLCFL